MIQKGLYSSGLEHYLFEYLMGFEAISAVRFLDLASKQNIPIYIIDSENSQRVDELEISSSDKQDINNLINAGRTILVPKSEIQYVDYTGIGYVAIDMNTGSGAYMISGGFAGGETLMERVEELLELAEELVGIYQYTGVVEGYKSAIRNILKFYPDIADSPVSEFPKFEEQSREIFYVGEAAKKIPVTQAKVATAQQILYNTIIMLRTITIP